MILCVLHDLFGVLVLSGNNKFTHVLVPRHEVLSKEESERLLKELGVKVWQLPRIAQDDPAIRDLNADVGQIVRVIRSSELVGEYEVYRLVVPSFSQKSASQKRETSGEVESAKEGVGAKPAKRVRRCLERPLIPRRLRLRHQGARRGARLSRVERVRSSLGGVGFKWKVFLPGRILMFQGFL